MIEKIIKHKFWSISLLIIILLLVGDFFIWRNTILNYLSSLNPSSDTLRYFFSSVFQGYAAIFTLGAMFYIYNSDKIDSKIYRMESNAKEMIESHNLIDVQNIYIYEVNTYGVFKYIEEYIINEPTFMNDRCYKSLERLLKFHKLYQIMNEKIQKNLFLIVKLSIFILFFSLLTLLFIQFNNNVCFNKIIFFIAIGFIYISVYYFYLLYNYISNSLGIYHVKIPENEKSE